MIHVKNALYTNEIPAWLQYLIDDAKFVQFHYIDVDHKDNFDEDPPGPPSNDEEDTPDPTNDDVVLYTQQVRQKTDLVHIPMFFALYSPPQYREPDP